MNWGMDRLNTPAVDARHKPIQRSALRLVCFVLLAAMASQVVTGIYIRAAEPVIGQMSSDELAQRGKELRAALQKTYQDLSRARKLSAFGTDITETVLPYIQAGMSFSDAEAILRNAGFIVRHPDLNQATNPNRAKDWYVVTARISRFATSFLFVSIDLFVTLLPKSPGDYTTVAEISATMFLSAP